MLGFLVFVLGGVGIDGIRYELVGDYILCLEVFGYLERDEVAARALRRVGALSMDGERGAPRQAVVEYLIKRYYFLGRFHLSRHAGAPTRSA